MTRLDRQATGTRVQKGQALLLVLATMTAGAQQLPRQSRVSTAAIQGQVRTEQGLGLGGVVIQLRNLSQPRTLLTMTAGDGTFRWRDLPAGSYEILGRLEGFEPFGRREVLLPAGDVFTMDVKMKPTGELQPDWRQVPRQSGPTPPALLAAILPAPNRPPLRPLAGTEPAAPATIEALPPDDKVFSSIPSRWDYDFPVYRRYGKKGEAPFVKGHIADPFNQNKIKGDYPVIGDRTFLIISATSETGVEGRMIPVPSGVGSERGSSSRFFGQFGQLPLSQTVSLSIDLFGGDTAFRPFDWRLKVTPAFNLNYLKVQERGIVNPDVRRGTGRQDSHLGLQEAFFEVKLKDLSNSFDFLAARLGIQSFNSDFRGFIFLDQEPGARLFGNLQSNRYQFNAAYFNMLEKDTNSGLNRFRLRDQQVLIGNIYRQDFIKPGYTLQASFHYNKDDASFLLDENNFLVRPAPIGAVTPHKIRAYYYGLTGDGHIGRLNVNHAFYQVLGHDSLNPLAGKPVSINAQMAAVELSVDKDWVRLRSAFFYASGDNNPRDGTARGFDAIFDDPNFAGGRFSFWNREGIRLTGTGVALVSPGSLLPSLRSSKIQGQANFVNPGIFLYNVGTDIDLSPRMRLVLNSNFMRFAHTQPLELLLFQRPIRAGLGADNGIGLVYRPALSENLLLLAGVNSFTPFAGFRDMLTGRTLLAVFVNVRFKF